MALLAIDGKSNAKLLTLFKRVKGDLSIQAKYKLMQVRMYVCLVW